jgi:putative phage-type endonuclease
MKIVKDIEQQSPEWFAIRKGKMTASHAQAIGNAGKGLETYIYDLVAEEYSSAEKEQFSNEHTERGNELEEVARGIYELENNVDVEQVTFIEYDEYVGCSPDGLVGENGLIEIKSPNDTEYLKYLIFGEGQIDTKYIWQCQMQMLVTGRSWNDLVIYNPNFKKSMLVYRIIPDKEKFEKLLNGFEVGKKLILEIKEKLKNELK